MQNEIFAGRYQVEEVIGAGGFATVYRARDTELGRRVALKVLRPGANSRVAPSADQVQRFYQRFRREAQIIARLKAPETVALYDFGVTDDGFAYMALEHVEGLNLWQVMTREERLAPERVATIVAGVLRSLREAHELGVHHRDLKPANIMIYEHQGERDLVKLLDFGVVKITKDIGVSNSALTSEGNVVGTPKYMAPEYVRDNTMSPQADIYSLGLVAWELLTGEPAAKGESGVELMSWHIDAPSLKLPEDLEMPTALRLAVNGMMEKSPGERFRTADEVLAVLEASEEEVAETRRSTMPLAARMEAREEGGEALEPREAPRQPEDQRQASPADRPGSTVGKPTLLVVAIIVGVALGAALWWYLRA